MTDKEQNGTESHFVKFAIADMRLHKYTYDKLAEE